jgi:predicted ATPase
VPPVHVAQNPIYGRTFVGREHELGQLDAAFAAARAGQGALAMVVGEPGIGKTALCEQLATSAVAQGGRSLVGHCYEPSSGPSLPYLPFVEALRGYVRSLDRDLLRAELGGGANRIVALLPELREQVAVAPEPPGRDADEERWYLFQAVSDLLQRAADRQPLLLVLEDLHWADRGTLDLLLHIARDLPTTRLLIVGTYRDVEVDHTDALSITLAELRRVRELPRLLLRGLSRDEVERLLTNVAGSEVRAALAEMVQRQTEGNPLFVQEIVRDLTEAGNAYEVGGPLPMPPGVQDVIARRLTGLSSSAHHLLTIAAVIGRQFRLDTLQQLANLAEGSLVAGLE